VTTVCLDTSAYAQFKKGHDGAVRVLSRAFDIVVPTVVLGELRAGFLLGKRQAMNERDLGLFLANPVVRVAGVNEDVAERYAELFVRLRKLGKPAPANDLWIAAVALREGARVLTFDRHFADILPVGAIILSDE